jgi:uncharacterized protein (DUF2062 family)
VLRRLWEKLKRLWTLAKSERASPRQIAWAVGMGAFIGCTPAVGIRPWLAIGLATLARMNRLFAYLGSHTSNVVFMPFIVLAEVQLSHRVRTGAWASIDRPHILDQAPTLLLDWCLGTIPVGLAVGLALGMLAYALARRRDAATPTPAAAPPPSSGSPA